MIILTDVSYAYCATIDHYYFSTIDRRAGLPNNSVSDILQDQIDCPRFTTKKSHANAMAKTRAPRANQ
jgi:hypothetical protein